jgi:hypothetical protein
MADLAGDLESGAAAAFERPVQARRDSARASGRVGHAFEHGERIANPGVNLSLYSPEQRFLRHFGGAILLRTPLSFISKWIEGDSTLR